MWFYISLWGGKFWNFLTHKFEKSDRCGMVSLRLYDNFLARVDKPKTVICVTGTNGKTTTNNLLCDVLEDLGYNVACNREGFNVRPGIARALMNKCTIFNKTTADIAVLEVDELSCDVILPKIKANYLIVSNLSSDTLLRNGHPFYVFDKIEKAIPPYTKLVLNSEDLISSRLKENDDNEKIFYSIKRQDFEKDARNTKLQDMRVCPKCNEVLDFDFVRYHHIGFAHCPKCDFTNKKPTYQIEKLDMKNNTFTLNGKTYKCVKGNGIFSAYNVLSIVAVLKDLGIKESDIEASLKNLKVMENRLNEIAVKNKTVVTNFLKGGNALSTCRSFDFASNYGEKTNVIIIIDDQHEVIKHGEFEYLSYKYESDYELLNNKNIDRIIVGGAHCYEDKLRLLLAGIDEKKIFVCEKEVDTNKYIDYKNCKNIIILYDLYSMDLMKTIVNNIKEDLK